jgi:hypothetical protein
MEFEGGRFGGDGASSGACELKLLMPENIGISAADDIERALREAA